MANKHNQEREEERKVLGGSSCLCEGGEALGFLREVGANVSTSIGALVDTGCIYHKRLPLVIMVCTLNAKLIFTPVGL